MEIRKEQQAAKNQTFIHIENNIYNLIMNSQQINRSKIVISQSLDCRLKRQSCALTQCCDGIQEEKET